MHTILKIVLLLSLSISGFAKFELINNFDDLHSGPVDEVNFHKTKNLGLTSDRSGAIVIYENSNAFKLENNPHERAISATAFDKNAFYLATGDSTGLVAIWNLAEKKVQTTFKLNRGVIALTIKDDTLFSFDRSGVFAKYDLSAQSETSRIELGGQYTKAAIASNTLYAGSRTGEVTSFSLSDGSQLSKVTKLETPIIDLEASSNGVVVVGKSGKSFISSLDLNTSYYENSEESFVTADIFKDKLFAVDSQNLKAVKYLIAQDLATTQSNQFSILDISVGNNGNRILTGARDGSVNLWKYVSGQSGGNDQGEESLFKAIEAGNIDVVKTLLDKGINVNSRNRNFETPFHIIWRSNNSTEVKEELSNLLLENDANVNLFDNRSMQAFELVSSESVKEAIKTYQDKIDNDLNFASENGNLNTVQKLMNAGAALNTLDLFGRTALMYASEKGNTALLEILLANKSVNILIENEYGETALSLAADDNTQKQIQNEIDRRREGLEKFKEALKNLNTGLLKYVVEEYGITPHLQDIKYAALGYTKEVYAPVFNLIRNNDIDSMKFYFQNGGFLTFDKNGYFQDMIRYSISTEALELFLDYGVNINKDKSSCPNVFVETAERTTPSYERLKYLVDVHGYDYNSKDCNGNPAFFKIIQNNEKAAFRWFVRDLKVDVNAKYANGKTALMHAVAVNNFQFAKALINSGAKTDTTDSNGRGLIFYLNNFEDSKMVELVKKNYIPNRPDSNGVLPLVSAIREKNIKKVESLLKLGEFLHVGNVSFIAVQPIQEIINLEWTEGLELFREYNYDFTRENLTENKLSAIHYAILKGSTDFIGASDINWGAKTQTGFNMAHLACIGDQVELVKTILRSNKEISLLDSNQFMLNGYDFCGAKTLELLFEDDSKITKLKVLFNDQNTEEDVIIEAVDDLFDNRKLKFSFNGGNYKLSKMAIIRGYTKLYLRETNNKRFLDDLLLGIKYKKMSVVKLSLESNLHTIFPKELTDHFINNYNNDTYELSKGFLEDLLTKGDQVPVEFLRFVIMKQEYHHFALKYLENGNDFNVNLNDKHLFQSLNTYGIPLSLELVKKYGYENFPSGPVDLLDRSTSSIHYKELIPALIEALKLHGFEFVNYKYDVYKLVKGYVDNSRNGLYLVDFIISALTKEDIDSTLGVDMMKFFAPKSEMLKNIKKIVEKGWSIDKRFGTNTRTLLMHCAFYGNRPCVEYALNSGADKKLKDSDGKRADRIAKKAGYPTLAKYIKKYK